MPNHPNRNWRRRRDAARAGWGDDEWIVGVDADSNHEYIVHLQPPRFIARFDDSGNPPPHIGYLNVATRENEFFAVDWLDGNPGLSDAELLDLFERADTAITRYSFTEESQ